MLRVAVNLSDYYRLMRAVKKDSDLAITFFPLYSRFSEKYTMIEGEKCVLLNLDSHKILTDELMQDLHKNFKVRVYEGLDRDWRRK